MRSINLYFVIVLSFVLFACKKSNSSQNGSGNGNYFTLKTGSTTHTGVPFFNPFDSTNYYDLSEQSINFVADTYPFGYGGVIYFSNSSLQHVEIVTPFDPSANPYEGISVSETDCNGVLRNFFNSVNITRNDNRVGGIIEGSFTGLFAKCQYLTSCDCYNASNVSCNFKLVILP